MRTENRIHLVLMFILISTNLFSQVVINEIMFDAKGSEYTDEFVEIVNISDSTIHFSGWRVGDGTSDDEIVDAGNGLDLLPGQYGLILDADYSGQSTSYDYLIPDSTLILTVNGSTIGSAGLSNSRAETIILSNAEGMIVDSCTYSIGNSHGHSDERLDVYAPNQHNWMDSQTILGTPGFSNSVAKLNIDAALCDFEYSINNGFTTLSVVLCNVGVNDLGNIPVTFFNDLNQDSLYTSDEEIITLHVLTLNSGDSVSLHTDWISPDPGIQNVAVQVFAIGDERASNDLLMMEIRIPFPERTLIINEVMFSPGEGRPEWIEIYNPHNNEIDLLLWMLSDLDTLDRKVVSNQTVLIQPLSYLIITRDSVFLDDYPYLSGQTIILSSFPSLNNEEDSIYLFDPSGYVIDNIGYSDIVGEPGVSLERIRPTGQSLDPNNWYLCTTLEGSTPGKQNSVFVEHMPEKISLDINPNPFSPDQDGYEDITFISFHLPVEIATIQCKVFDVRGRLIKTLQSGHYSGANGQLVWDGLDNNGQKVRIGIYILFLEALDSRQGVVLSEKKTVVVAGRL